MVGKLKEVQMGKIIKTILATEDNDPIGLLNTYGIFNPKKYKPKELDNKDFKEVKLIQKKRTKNRL